MCLSERCWCARCRSKRNAESQRRSRAKKRRRLCQCGACQRCLWRARTRKHRAIEKDYLNLVAIHLEMFGPKAYNLSWMPLLAL